MEVIYQHHLRNRYAVSARIFVRGNTLYVLKSVGAKYYSRTVGAKINEKKAGEGRSQRWVCTNLFYYSS